MSDYEYSCPNHGPAANCGVVQSLRERITLLEARIHEAKEIYIGMEGFVPETAPEAYQKRALDQMWEALQEDKPQ